MNTNENHDSESGWTTTALQFNANDEYIFIVIVSPMHGSVLKLKFVTEFGDQKRSFGRFGSDTFAESLSGNDYGTECKMVRRSLLYSCRKLNCPFSIFLFITICEQQSSDWAFLVSKFSDKFCSGAEPRTEPRNYNQKASTESFNIFVLYLIE